MRVIGGKYRGLKLITPKDDKIRPTTDRMRETIFNILDHNGPGLMGAHVLDVFAGTGALGIEALSRGAAHVTFFDKDRNSLQLVSKNITLLKAEENTTIRCISALSLPPADRQYDYILLDPPYGLDIIPDTLAALRDQNYIAPHCLITVEYSAKNSPSFPDFLSIIKEKTYGDTSFSLLRNISR